MRRSGQRSSRTAEIAAHPPTGYAAGMPTYPATTDVPVDKSRAELERTLERYGADEFL